MSVLKYPDNKYCLVCGNKLSFQYFFAKSPFIKGERLQCKGCGNVFEYTESEEEIKLVWIEGD